MDVDAGTQSLFVVVSRYCDTPYPTSIIRLETPVPNHEHASSTDVQVIQTDFSAHIPDLPLFERDDIWWGISASSTEDLYILLDWASRRTGHVGSFPGLIFNLSTKKCKIIKAPLSPKYLGYVATLGDHIYLMSEPTNDSPSFERYDTLSQSWEELKPPPYNQLTFGPFNSKYGRLDVTKAYINGSAVLDDTILFNMKYGEILAYNVGRNKWYTVNVLDKKCHTILGEAVVLNKRIYTLGSQSVVTLTLNCQESHGDLVFTCDLEKEYVMPGMFIFKGWHSFGLERRLVHLGKDNFCIVQSCSRSGVVECNPYIRITYIELSEKKSMSIVTNICLHEFKCPDGECFMIRHCFSMPKCKTTALREGTTFNPEHEAEIVTLPPELLMQSHDKYSTRRKIIAEQDEQRKSAIQSRWRRDHADTAPEIQEVWEDVPKKSSASLVAAKSNVPSKTSTISAESRSYAKPSSATKASTRGDVAASGRTNTDEEGHYICVRNLPPDFNVRQLQKELKKFGPFKSFGINIDFSDMSKSECWVAIVEFESETSKQNAIKASRITIGGRIALIEKREEPATLKVE